MFLNKDSIIIDGVSMGQYITQAEYQYNKLWGSDSGRNLAGEQTGTLIGIFPKLVLSFRRLNAEELRIIAPILDNAYQQTTYDDDSLGQSVTMTTYTGDWSVANKRANMGEPFQCSFISVRKRGG